MRTNKEWGWVVYVATSACGWAEGMGVKEGCPTSV